jgi:hypothetical protein
MKRSDLKRINDSYGGSQWRVALYKINGEDRVVLWRWLFRYFAPSFIQVWSEFGMSCHRGEKFFRRYCPLEVGIPIRSKDPEASRSLQAVKLSKKIGVEL